MGARGDSICMVDRSFGCCFVSYVLMSLLLMCEESFCVPRTSRDDGDDSQYEVGRGGVVCFAFGGDLLLRNHYLRGED